MTMNEQLQFGQPVARRSDPVTSHQAAADAKRGAATLRARCLAALKAAPDGLTDFQLADRVGSQQTSAGKRRGELVKAGLVEATDETRPSPSGSQARVWRSVLCGEGYVVVDGRFACPLPKGHVGIHEPRLVL